MNVNVKKVLGKMTHGLVFSALALGGAFFMYAPPASAHYYYYNDLAYYDMNGYRTTADHCWWTSDAEGNRYLVVDYRTTSPYPFRLSMDDGYMYNGHWYTFAHRYYTHEGDGCLHTYYYYRYEPHFGGGLASDYNQVNN